MIFVFKSGHVFKYLLPVLGFWLALILSEIIRNYVVECVFEIIIIFAQAATAFLIYRDYHRQKNGNDNQR